MKKLFLLLPAAVLLSLLLLNGCGKDNPAAGPTVTVKVNASKF